MRSLFVIAMTALLSASLPGAIAAAPAGMGRDTIEFGIPRVASVSMSDVVVDVPVRLKPIGVAGTIDRVVFTDLRLNGIPFEVADYDTPFELPAESPVDLPQPIRLRANFANVAPGVISEAIMPTDTLRLTGRVIVAGTFRKWVFTFRRTADVRVDETGPNPIADYHPLRAVLAEIANLERLGIRLPF